MSSGFRHRFYRFHQRLQTALVGPPALAFLPAIILGGYWFGGEAMLLFLALVFPAAFAISGLFSGTGPAWEQPLDRETGLPMRPAAENAIDDILGKSGTTGSTTAAVALALDNFPKFERQYGTKAAGEILKMTAERIVATARDTDVVVRLEGARFGIAFGPIRRADLETMIQFSSRLQAAIAEPYPVDATRVFMSASVGFCVVGGDRARSGPELMEMAEAALENARANGNCSIRAYSSKNRQRTLKRASNHEEVAHALENNQIFPWFQPQVSTDTGKITGFEALARGYIPPVASYHRPIFCPHSKIWNCSSSFAKSCFQNRWRRCAAGIMPGTPSQVLRSISRARSCQIRNLRIA